MWKDISDLNTAIDEFEPFLLALYFSIEDLDQFRFNTSELVVSDNLFHGQISCIWCWVACPLQKFIYLSFIRLAEFENIKSRIDCREIKGQTPKTKRDRVNVKLNEKSYNAF